MGVDKKKVPEKYLCERCDPRQLKNTAEQAKKIQVASQSFTSARKRPILQAKVSERLKKVREDRERRRQARREKKERRKQKKLERLQRAREAAAQANVLSLVDLQKFVEIGENEYTKVGILKSYAF